MKPDKLLTILVLAAGLAIPDAASVTALHFLTPPVVERFPDGALEWRGTLNCPDPGLFSNVRVVFFFDYNLDGIADGNRDSTALSAADCEGGEASVVHTLFPSRSGVLNVELRQGNTLLDHSFLFAGSIGSLLSIHRFCSRPSNGEPEWVEVGNPSPSPVDLSVIRVEGHLLSGTLEPGANVLVGRDSADLLRWQPGASIIATSSWSSLRNTGDTLRLTWNGALVLDSIIYGSAIDAREGCASALTEEDVAAAAGYAMDVSPTRWNPRIGPLILKVQAPPGGNWNLSAYDLDGFELCSVARNKTGSAQIQFSAPDCSGLVNRNGSVLLQLRPKNSVSIRKRIRVLKPQ